MIFKNGLIIILLFSAAGGLCSFYNIMVYYCFEH